MDWDARNTAIVVFVGLLAAGCRADVSRAYNLRMNAIIQQQAISLGGKITYLDGQAATSQSVPVVPTGNGGGRGADRTWEYWLRVLPN